MSQATELIAKQMAAGASIGKIWGTLIFNPKDTAYGAVGNGTTDDTASCQAAINAAYNAGGGVVHFPPGTYKTTSALIVKTNVIISGAGRHLSLIYPSIASMTVFDLTQTALTRTYNEIYSIGIVAQAASITGIKSVLASALRFEDIFFGGCLYNFNIDRGTNIQIEGILVEGTGAPSYAAGKSLFQDTTKLDYLYDLQITDYQIRNIGNGVQDPSVTFNRCVGAFITGYHVNDLSSGGVGSTQASGILYSGDCQGCKFSTGIIVRPQAYGVKYITEGSPAKYPIAMTITDVDVDQSQGVGFQIDAGFWYTITGGSMTDILSHGIIIGSNNTTVEGTKIIHCTYQGIQVNANVNNFIIEGSHIEQCTTAILVSAGTSDNYIIRDNNLSIINTNKIVDNGTGINKLIGGNLGIDNSYKNEYVDTLVFSLTGGAATESKTIAIPAGLFATKPKTGFLLVSGTPVTPQIIGFYDYDNVGNSATAAVFTLAKNDGTVLGTGSYRYNVLLKG